jgi:hypothetical protein
MYPASIVSDYGVDDRAIRIRSRQKQNNYFSVLCIQTGSGAHPYTCQKGIAGLFPGAKARSGRYADYSSLHKAEVVNE